MEKNKRPYLFQYPSKLVVMVILLLIPVSAFAYLDPTTGSMLISAIVGLFASLVLAIKTYWYRIKTFFKAKPTQNNVDDETT